MRRRTRQRDTNSPPSTCEHLGAAAERADPEPQSPGRCQDCAELGETIWAHLRMCLTCGHVACCDSSPHKHATAHFHATDHAVMRSIEPGEAWRWCYLDMLVDAGPA